VSDPIIRQLDPATSLKIAAGEVIERPASVVKELLENALDADATRIAVTLRGGGLDYARVVDNGMGIAAADMPLVFARHATSKITRVDDLQELVTFGFRGEALASIASIAEVTILSRPRNAENGMAMTVRAGQIVDVSPAGCPVGTSITVRNLFENVPARLKFVRSAPAETGLIAQTVGLYAVAHAAVHLTFAADNRVPIVYPGDGNQRAAAAAILGDEAARALLPLDPPAAGEPVRVEGFVSDPSVHRPTRSGLHFYVNRRPFQSRMLQVAVAEAYRLLLPEGRHPVGIIFLDIDPADVDVNVHPRKWEVRFVRDREVFAAVQRAVRRALAELASPPIVSASLQSIGANIETPASHLSSATQERQTESSPLARNLTGEATSAASGPVADRSGVTAPPDQPPLFALKVPPADANPEPTLAGGQHLPVMRILGQVQNTYVVCEGPDGIYFIDQHTAHERVLYEEILAQRARSGVARQALLEPVVVELTPAQSARLGDVGETASTFGFEIEPFGDRAALIRAVPAPLARTDPARVLPDLIDALLDNRPTADGSDRGIATIACHSAVRAGDSLTPTEMRELIEQLERTDLGRICPHGRPTVIRLPASQLERDFHRR
jgi:DNA mismatch repair protein MutL